MKENIAKSPKAVLLFELDHEDGVIRAQTWLKGRLTIDAKEKLVSLKEIKLDLIGRELVSERAGLMKTLHVKEELVFEEHHVIHEFGSDDALEPGKTVYPFSIYLPAAVPPSMDYGEKNNVGCKVEYVLTGTLKGIAQTTRKLRIVGATLSNKIYTKIVEPTSFPLKSGPLRDKGFFVMGAKVTNSHVGKGQKLEFALACRNKSSIDVRRVDVEFVEEISWICALGHNHRTTTALVELKDIEGPGLIMEAESTSWLDRHKPIEVGGITYTQIQDDIAAKRNVMSLRIPFKARDSYEGKLLKVSHFLRAILVTGGKQRNPHLAIPIQVFDPPIETGSPHAPSKSMIVEVATTAWPDEENVLKRPTHLAELESSSNCSSIRESHNGMEE